MSLVWGSAFLLVKVTVEEVPPLTLTAGRLALSAVLLHVLMRASGLRWGRQRSLWATLAFMGLVNNVLPFTLIAWGQQHISSSLAAILNATTPLFTVIIAYLAATERLDLERGLGVAIGFGGAVVLVGPDLGHLTASSTLGQLAVVVGSLGFAVATVVARERLQGVEPLVAASGQLAMAAVFIGPVALLVDRPFDVTVSPKAAAAWVGLAALPSGLAYVLFLWLIQRITAVQVSLVSYLIPVTATFLGWLVLDERLGLNVIAGLLLIILGLLAVNGAMGPALRRLCREVPAAGPDGRR